MGRSSNFLRAVAIMLIAAFSVGTYNNLHAEIAHNQGYKWGNALQVAHPEYQITHRGDADTDRGAFSATTGIELFAQENAVFSTGPRRLAQFSEDIFGRVDFPELGPAAMSPYLAAFKGGTPALDGEKERAMAQARSVPRHQLFIVLVELTRSLRESELPVRFENGQWQRYFLSGAPTGPGKPLYWWPGWGGCSAITNESQNCGPRTVFDDFEKWVSQFTEDDQDNLRAIGLDLQRLRAAVAERRVYGFTQTVRGRSEILDLLGKPQVRTVHIVAPVPDIDE